MKKGSVTSKLTSFFFLLSIPKLLRQELPLLYAEFHYCRSKPWGETVKQPVPHLKRCE
jgi:hypothetical protein